MMENKIFTKMQKKKANIAFLTGTLMITLGAGAAFAGNAATTKHLIKNENGVTQYSTDDGETWNEGFPEGVTVTEDENGRSFITNDTLQPLPSLGEMNSLMIKDEDGVTSYSTDGGETWSNEVPEGVIQNEDGSMSNGAKFSTGAADDALPPLGEGAGMLIRNENGVVTHSSDGGDTWNEGYPEGATVTEDGNSVSVFFENDGNDSVTMTFEDTMTL